MDRGEVFEWHQLLRFNGRFFADAEVLPVDLADLAVLHQAAEANWRFVEPTIFGTLLTRALDPVERHRLGAEYTPREYVERVVVQTVDVPLRERWTPVQAHVAELRASGKKKDARAALKELREFHAWLRGLRFLDPACGSGNFLYVCLHLVKRLELEVLREIEEITGNPELGIEEVGPAQFHGIEIKPWAREIAELTLWIGYHQFWIEHHKGVNPPQPVLRDTGTLDLRDAVLAWDEIVEVPEKSRPDPTPRIPHPVTGKLVPDPAARLPYYEYRGARQAEWPRADFIIGNPPYMGGTRMREAFGAGYVDALRSVYPSMEGVDYVMYWWLRAGALVATRSTIRAGLITTNSIIQPRNREVIERVCSDGARIRWAVADHPWVDEAGSAAVRVAFTVIAADNRPATLAIVSAAGTVVGEKYAGFLNSDLTMHADVVGASGVKLRGNEGLAAMGFALYGAGFLLSRSEYRDIHAHSPDSLSLMKPYLAGRDLTGRPRDQYVIDFRMMSEVEAREHPVLYNLVFDRVKPERDAKARKIMQERWWQFGWPRPELRKGLVGLRRYIATAYVAKHRFFTFLDTIYAPDDTLVVIASDDGFHLGVLQSWHHVLWALATGGRLGVGNDPRYNKARCFDPFPFPDPPKELRGRIAEVAERLDRHRKDALERDERVTMTGMYNVVEKLRSGEALTPRERDVHQIAACGVLRDIHDELDRLVARAYGWPWPMEREALLERLVALHDERVAEEKRGLVRWLRPDYQVPRFGGGLPAPEPELDLVLPESEAAPPAGERRPWPAGAIDQIAAIKAVVAAAPATVQEATAVFTGAPAALVRRYLETLVIVGEVRTGRDRRYQAVAEPV